MSESPSPQSHAATQATTLVARFDAARDTFLAAFAQAPDTALPYTPAGEDYALGILPLHLQDSMNHYLDVYARMVAANYGPVDLSADPAHAEQEAEQHRRLTATKPTGADRATLLADMNATHRRLAQQCGALDDAAIARTVDVVYSPGANPYPTSVAAIFGWLSDHYDEHTEQTAHLLAQWESVQAQ